MHFVEFCIICISAWHQGVRALYIHIFVATNILYDMNIFWKVWARAFWFCFEMSRNFDKCYADGLFGHHRIGNTEVKQTCRAKESWPGCTIICNAYNHVTAKCPSSGCPRAGRCKMSIASNFPNVVGKLGNLDPRHWQLHRTKSRNMKNQNGHVGTLGCGGTAS